MRMVDVLRLLIGTHGLVTPAAAARAAFGPQAGAGARTTVLVLGARQSLQGVVGARTGWRALSAGVDVLHAASMLLLLVAAPRRAARFAASQVLTAAVLVALELGADRHR